MNLDRFVKYLLILNVILSVLTFFGLKPNVEPCCYHEQSMIVLTHIHDHEDLSL